MDIINLFNICDEIQSNTSTLKKKEILKRESDNNDFKELLKFTNFTILTVTTHS